LIQVSTGNLAMGATPGAWDRCQRVTQSLSRSPFICQPPKRPVWLVVGRCPDSVLAVYREDWGLASSGEPAIILVAWPDGHIIWSGDRLKGGAPYRAGHADPKRVTALLARFHKDGLFADEK